ncbi:MAG: transposase [Anaerolineae bacterium]|nr:transposase [Anaerolineae bacterium]
MARLASTLLFQQAEPFVERTIQTLKYECLLVAYPDSPLETADCLERFAWFYNHERPHQGLSCGNRPPFTAFPDRPTLPALPEMVNPDRWVEGYHGKIFQRRVRANGTVVIDDHFYVIGPHYAGQSVALQLDAVHQTFQVLFMGKPIQVLPMKGLHFQTYPFQKYLDLMMNEATRIEQARFQHWYGTNWEEPFH